MTSLYSLRSTPAEGEFTIIKLSIDYEVEALYALNLGVCTCPAGHRPKCKHRVMLPMFLKFNHVNDGWLLDWDTRMWRKPVGDAEFQAEQSERSAIAGLADQALMGNADQMAAKIAPAFMQETSYMVPKGTDGGTATAKLVTDPPATEARMAAHGDRGSTPTDTSGSTASFADRREGPREPTPSANAVLCKRTGEGIAVKLGGGQCACASADECRLAPHSPAVEHGTLTPGVAGSIPARAANDRKLGEIKRRKL